MNYIEIEIQEIINLMSYLTNRISVLHKLKQINKIAIDVSHVIDMFLVYTDEKKV